MSEDREPVVPPAESGSLLPAVAGAVVWSLHFFMVYLLAEARCSIAFSGSEFGGIGGVVFFTVAATLVAITVIAVYAWGSWRRWRDDGGQSNVEEQERMLGKLGVINAGTFALATISVGVIVLFLPPC